MHIYKFAGEDKNSVLVLQPLNKLKKKLKNQTFLRLLKKKGCIGLCRLEISKPTTQPILYGLEGFQLAQPIDQNQPAFCGVS